MRCKTFLFLTSVACLAALSSPALADDWGFGFGFNTGSRYHHAYRATRTYAYCDSSPVVYYEPEPTVVYNDYDPDVVVYDRAPRACYRTYVPARTVVYSDYSPVVCRSSYYGRAYYGGHHSYRSYYRPSHTYSNYGHGTTIRAHGRSRH